MKDDMLHDVLGAALLAVIGYGLAVLMLAM